MINNLGTIVKLITTIIMEFIDVNKNRSLWMQKSDDAKNEEYASCYNFLLNGWEDHFMIKDLNFGMTMNEMINHPGPTVRSLIRASTKLVPNKMNSTIMIKDFNINIMMNEMNDNLDTIAKLITKTFMEVIVVNKKGPLWEDHRKIEDLSIGMTMNEMINNLGAIVKSIIKMYKPLTQ